MHDVKRETLFEQRPFGLCGTFALLAILACSQVRRGRVYIRGYRCILKRLSNMKERRRCTRRLTREPHARLLQVYNAGVDNILYGEKFIGKILICPMPPLNRHVFEIPPCVLHNHRDNVLNSLLSMLSLLCLFRDSTM